MPKKGKAASPQELAEAARQAEAEAQLLSVTKEVIRYKDLSENEERRYNSFLQEREKINYFWIVEKKSLEEAKADLRNKDREIQDQEERHQIELKMFQQRLKHLRYHHLDGITDQKIELDRYRINTQTENAKELQEHLKDIRALAVEKKEAEMSQDEFVRMLKLTQDQEIYKIRLEFDRLAREVQQKYALNMKILRELMEKERKKQLLRIENNKNEYINKLMKDNMKSFADIKIYYGDITTSNLDLIKRLKEELAELKKRETTDAKQMYDLRQKNKQLNEPLRRACNDVLRLQDQLKVYKLDKEKLETVKEKIAEQTKVLQALEFQQEVMLQQSEIVQNERDDYYHKFQSTIYEVQQKAGLKNLLLEKKLDSVEEALEITDAQVSEMVLSAELPPQNKGMSQKLDEIISYKNDVVTNLHDDIQHIKDAHREMVKRYESVLATYGFPKEELGFTAVQM